MGVMRLKCDDCKRRIAEAATSLEAHNRRFVIKFNEALAELQEEKEPGFAFSLFMMNVDDVVRPQAEHNNLTLAEFYRKWADIKEKILEAAK